MLIENAKPPCLFSLLYFTLVWSIVCSLLNYHLLFGDSSQEDHFSFLQLFKNLHQSWERYKVPFFVWCLTWTEWHMSRVEIFFPGIGTASIIAISKMYLFTIYLGLDTEMNNWSNISFLVDEVTKVIASMVTHFLSLTDSVGRTLNDRPSASLSSFNI